MRFMTIYIVGNVILDCVTVKLTVWDVIFIDIV